ncbi:Aberrant root formation protein 4 [Linum perenne]
MLSILCEALDSLSTSDDPGYAAPLLTGLSKVFISIKRRHFEQAKVVVPVILKVLKVLSLELADREVESVPLFKRALLMVDSINAVSRKLDHGVCEKLQAVMALFILQTMALVSASIPSALSGCVSLVLDMSKLLPQCGLTYLGLLTGSDIDVKSNLTTNASTEEEEEEEVVMSSFSDIKQGGALSVIWGHISDEIAREARENMSAAGKTNQTGALRRSNLVKAYNEWLLPLRTLVNGIMAAEPEDDPDELARCLNPVILVLYHCIELVEESLSSANQDST